MKSALVAFSGGLDTSFLVPFCRERYGLDEIITCTVDTGGFSIDERERIARRSRELGAEDHVFVEAAEEFYDSIVKYLIYGNVSRDGYPLCVGSERIVQGRRALEVCRSRNIGTFIHGSTGAGNDQFRFDLVAHVLGQGEIECLAPIREFGVSRTQATEYLHARGISVPERSTSYSYNVGLWGVSIGGAETHDSNTLLPEHAWYSVPDRSLSDAVVTLTFERGEVIHLGSPWGEARTAVDIIKKASEIGSKFGIGRHYHVGTSLPGKKGRLAYESPAADLIYEAHRTLEKITLTSLQIHGKRGPSDEFGRLLHEAQSFDPYFEDLAAFLESTQRRVTGTVSVHLTQGYIKAATADSPWNLLKAHGATYGETSNAYTGADARGACRLHAFEQELAYAIGVQPEQAP